MPLKHLDCLQEGLIVRPWPVTPPSHWVVLGSAVHCIGAKGQCAAVLGSHIQLLRALRRDSAGKNVQTTAALPVSLGCEFSGTQRFRHSFFCYSGTAGHFLACPSSLPHPPSKHPGL